MGLAGFNRMRRLKTHPIVKDVSGRPLTYQELRALAKERKIEGYHKMNTEELREALKEGD